MVKPAVVVQYKTMVQHVPDAIRRQSNDVTALLHPMHPDS
jgi:GTP:adenosylcobinamide-phosphate guanylyltransferase